MSVPSTAILGLSATESEEEKMKKKGKKDIAMAMPPTPYKPDPKADRLYAAQGLADTMMRTHPKMKAMKNHITREVQKAAHRAMSGQAKKGRFGY